MNSPSKFAYEKGQTLSILVLPETHHAWNGYSRAGLLQSIAAQRSPSINYLFSQTVLSQTQPRLRTFVPRITNRFSQTCFTKPQLNCIWLDEHGKPSRKHRLTHELTVWCSSKASFSFDLGQGCAMSVSNIGKPNPNAWLVFGFRIRDCGYLKERRGRFSVFAFVTVDIRRLFEKSEWSVIGYKI